MITLRAVLADPVALLAIVVALALAGGCVLLTRATARIRRELAEEEAYQAETREAAALNDAAFRMHRWLEQQRAIRAARRRNRPADSESQDMPRRSEA